MKPRIVALLPMKGNSTRVKGKNFRDFCGKPLFRWVLETLLDVKSIDQIIINTDARHMIDDFTSNFGDRVLIRDRKPEICGDEVSMNAVLADDIANVSADIYLMTHTTNPLLRSSLIIKAIDMFRSNLLSESCDSLFTVNKHQTRFYRSDASPVNHDPDNLIPTQQIEPWFEENSNLYLFTSDSFAKTGARIGANPAMLETPVFESIDIDTPEDWDLAVAAFAFLRKLQ